MGENSNEIIKLLKEVVFEIKGLRNDLKSTQADTLSPDDTLRALGLNNPGYLKYYVDKDLLKRRKGGKSFVYLKESVKRLAESINSGREIPPPARKLYE